MIGSGVLSIITTFFGQFMLNLGGGHHNAPFYPFGYFIMSLMLLALVPALSFNGQYLRLYEDRNSLRNVVGGGGDKQEQEYAAVNTAEDA
jgi:hypothetical protein